MKMTSRSGEKSGKRRSSWRRTEFRKKHQEEVSHKMQRFGMKPNIKENLLNKWDTVLALAVENGWKKQVNEMAKVWVSTADPDDKKVEGMDVR